MDLGGRASACAPSRYAAVLDQGKVVSEVVEKSPADFELCKPDALIAFLKNLKPTASKLR